MVPFMWRTRLRADRSHGLVVCTRLLVFLLLPIVAGACRESAPSGYRPTHPQARYLDRDRVDFDDGDTFLLDGAPVRILGIDTPETKSPSVGIMEDQPYGPEAADSTRALMTRAALLEWVPDGRDTYGRRLAHVLIDGRLLAVELIRMGLAYENVSYFGDNGFPDLAQEILDASRNAPRPPFEPPHRWRKKHQNRR
jgi:endonuclease YncB( thermonuclease family)